jgi:hypothetical protein
MSFICYLQNIALGAALMARLFRVPIGQEKNFGPVLAGVCSISLLLIIGIKKIEHSSRDRTLPPAATPVTNPTRWLNNRPTVFRELGEKPCRNLQPRKMP